ncbi:GntR family transcriptional regulator [Streptomyces cellulosae]|uniref:GntR family transcriptional regulator n=1 Tax=Streptomyces cellulosae TaxID=1968 RepID=UPI0004C68203|nr:GntR family transcriptional regulator [Streptomyces cellulosae]
MGESGLDPAFGGELLSESVKRLLLDRIMQGHYKPGERIVEMRLAKELGTSQSPVREALRDLAAIGVVAIHSRRGARVRMPTSKELADVSLVRSEIDALAARLAVAQLDDRTIDELQGAYDEMLACLERQDYLGMTRADAHFHQTIAQASANLAVTRVFDQLEPFARTFITLTLPNVDVRAIVHEHKGILTALQKRDPQAAAERARTHQINVSNLLRDHYSPDIGLAQGEQAS